MDKLTLPIEAGKKYVRRDGEVITAQHAGANYVQELLYVGTEGAGKNPNNEWLVWARTGRICYHPDEPSPFDLVADYVEGAASLQKPAEHPYASILRAIADGLEVQWNDHYGNWGSQNARMTLNEITEALYPPGRYRIKPRTVTVNGIELPAPETVPPADGTICFFPNLATSGALSFVWAGTPVQLQALADGIVHLTKYDATQWEEALLSITKVATARAAHQGGNHNDQR